MKLYVIGLGPGEQTQMTPKAMAAIGDSDVIAGYTVYIDLIKHLTEEKEILTTPMKQEVDRCRMAIEEAVKGKTVSMVCSGDAGVYGMAGLIYELSTDYPPIEIEIIPAYSCLQWGSGSWRTIDSRFCRHLTQRLTYPLGVNRNKTSQRSKIRFCPMFIQSFQ